MLSGFGGFMLGFFVFIFGLILGSFLNVCIYRIPRGESIAYPPSHCTNCDNKIKWYDLIPVVSYIFLRGKCRYCKEKISLRYPLIELITGVIFLALYIDYGLSFNFYKFLCLSALLIVIGMIDLDTTDVYFSTTLSGIIFGIVFIIYGYFLGYSPWNYLSGGALSGGIIALIIFITKGMGWGDFEICLMSGLFLGFKFSILMLFLSFVLGGIIAIMLIILGIKSRKDYIPFGQFIALGTIITCIYGDKIINWYLNMF